MSFLHPDPNLLLVGSPHLAEPGCLVSGPGRGQAMPGGAHSSWMWLKQRPQPSGCRAAVLRGGIHGLQLGSLGRRRGWGEPG